MPIRGKTKRIGIDAKKILMNKQYFSAKVEKMKSGAKKVGRKTYNAGKRVGKTGKRIGKAGIKVGRASARIGKKIIIKEAKACKTFIQKVPNILTTGRIIFVPIICVLMYFDNFYTRILSIVFAGLACVSDFFDGKLARKYKAVSPFGRCMDPIADKTLVMALIIMLIYLEKAWVFPCVAILFREFVVAGIREFIAKEQHITIHVSYLAKIKTATQMLALLFLMILGTNQTLKIIGNILLTVAAILSLITSYQYIKQVKKFISF